MDEYIRYHNGTKKSSTRYIQNDIRDLNNADLIDIILNNIFKSFKKNIINPLTSPGEVVSIFRYPYLSEGAPTQSEDKGLIEMK